MNTSEMPPGLAEAVAVPCCGNCIHGGQHRIAVAQRTRAEKYGIAISKNVICRRYPSPMDKGPSDHCGEHSHA